MKSRIARRSFLFCCALFIAIAVFAAPNDASEDYFPVKIGGKIGFIDRTGKVVIAPQFDSVFSEDGLSFSEGLAAVGIAGKWGYIDRSGMFVIKPRFDGEHFSPSLFHEGLAQVQIKETSREKGVLGGSEKITVREEVVRFIDKSGEFVESLTFVEERTKFSEGLAKVRVGDRFGFVDKTGKFVIEASFAEAEDFKEGLAAVRLETTGSFSGDDEYKIRYGFIDRTGKFVITPQFSSAESFSEGLAAVSVEFAGKTGFIDKNGAVVIAPKFDRASPFSEGLAKVVADDKAGFIDVKGRLVIGYRFHDPGFGTTANYNGFKEGLAAVEVNGRSGFIDKTGKMVIAPQYSYCSDFHSGLAQVNIPDQRDGYLFYYIDKSGKIIWKQKSE